MKQFLSSKIQTIELAPIRKIFEMASVTPNLIRLEVGQPHFPTPDHIIEGTKDFLSQGHIGYSSSSGLLETRKALAERLNKDYGFVFDPESEVVICNGASSAVYLTLRILINPGEEVLRPDPGWAQYDGAIQDAGGKPVLYSLVPEDGYSIDFEYLYKKISSQTKAIIINTPSNPTGGVLDKIQLEKLIGLAREKDIIIISDESYDKIIFEKSHLPPATIDKTEKRIVTVGSCSKNYAMSGWRIGYAIGAAEIISQVSKLQSLINICPNQLADKAAEIAFRDTQEPVLKMKQEYWKARDFFVQGLNEIPGFKCSIPDGAFYAFVDISAYKIGDWDFTKHLIKEVGVTCIPGSSFGRKGAGFIRFSYASALDILAEGLRRMKLHLPKLLP